IAGETVSVLKAGVTRRADSAGSARCVVQRFRVRVRSQKRQAGRETFLELDKEGVIIPVLQVRVLPQPQKLGKWTEERALLYWRVQVSTGDELGFLFPRITYVENEIASELPFDIQRGTLQVTLAQMSVEDRKGRNRRLSASFSEHILNGSH